MLKSLINWWNKDHKDDHRSPPESPKPSVSRSGPKHLVINDTRGTIMEIPSKEDNIRWPNVIRSSVVDKKIIPPIPGLLMRGTIDDKLAKVMQKFDALELDSPRPKRKTH